MFTKITLFYYADKIRFEFAAMKESSRLPRHFFIRVKYGREKRITEGESR